MSSRILPPQLTFEQALRLGYTGRIELRPYLDWLRTLPCDTCGARPPSDPSHVNSFKGASTKSPDPWAIPQCRQCHEVYERGSALTDERLRRAALYLLQAIYAKGGCSGLHCVTNRPMGPAGVNPDFANLSAAQRRIIRRALKILQARVDRGAPLTSPGAVRDYLKLLLGFRAHEIFVAIFLDAQHRVIASEEMFHGTLTQASVYPREVVKAALQVNAAAVIFAHNHPSGVAQPSASDELLTRGLKNALDLIEVRVLDHFIIAGCQAISFAERGLI